MSDEAVLGSLHWPPIVNQKAMLNNYPANIRLDEDVLKTS